MSTVYHDLADLHTLHAAACNPQCHYDLAGMTQETTLALADAFLELIEAELDERRADAVECMFDEHRLATNR